MALEVVAGRIDLAFATLPSVLGQVQGGEIKGIAIASNVRAPQLPDIALLKEQGVADAEADSWLALFAPAATPKPVLEALFKASTAALAAPAVKEAFAKQNFIAPALPKSLEESAKWLTGEFARWTTITNEVKLDLN